MTGHEPADDEGGSDREQPIGTGGGVASTLRKRIGNGTLALAAGSVLLARAARTATRSRGRAAVRALAGAGLIVVGVRQRRSAGTAEPPVQRPAPGERSPTAADTGTPEVTFPDRPDEQREATEDQVEIDISEADESGQDDAGTEVGGDVRTDEAGGDAGTGEVGGEAGTDEVEEDAGGKAEPAGADEQAGDRETGEGGADDDRPQ